MTTNPDLQKKIDELYSKLRQEEKQQYLVQVHIIEARELAAVDTTGTSDPFVRITVGNLTPQVTKTKSGASTVVYDQNFTFDGLMLSQIEFENFEIQFEVFDYNDFVANKLIGSYSIGLSTLYRNAKHEFYNQWLPLFHQDKKGNQGDLLVSCYIVKENDRPPVHEANEVYIEQENDPFKDIPEDELTVEQQLQKKQMKTKLQTVQRPITQLKQLQLLVNLVKAEDLILMGSNRLDPFISVRTGGNVLATQYQSDTQKPSFLTKLKYPIKWPAYNASIIVYLWDHRTFISDTYIGQIPEHPSDNEYLNINFLMSQGGIMKYRWFNVYGIPHNERPSGWGEKKMYSEGTQYMGRVLLSLSLSPSDKPDLGVASLGAYREPKILKYYLRVHSYEIQGTHDFGDCIKVVVKVGSKESLSHHCTKKKTRKDNKKDENKKKSEDHSTYEWKYSMIKNHDDMKIDLPENLAEQPDIIISVYEFNKDKKLLSEKRQAFARINSQSQDLKDSDPKWIQLKPVSPEQNLNAFFLCNIQLIPEGKIREEKEKIIKRTEKIDYIFRAYLYAGYDFCTEEDDYTKIEVQPVIGRNPIWNKVIQHTVKLDQKLQFASNLVICGHNNYPLKQEKNIWQKFIGTIFADDHEIGECIVKLDSMLVDMGEEFGKEKFNDATFKPQYKFYHLRKKGISKGRILAAFHLFPINQKQYETELPKQLNKSPVLNPLKFKMIDLQFPVIGVRNLAEKLKKPQVILRVSQDQNINKKGYWQRYIDFKDDENEIRKNYPKGLMDPTFCQLITTIKMKQNEDDSDSENSQEDEQITPEQKKQKLQDSIIKIPYDMRFAPQVELEFRDQNGGMSEVYMCSINLIEYIPWCLNRQVQQNVYNWFEEGKYSFLLDDLQMILDSDEKEVNDRDGNLNEDSEEDGEMLLKERIDEDFDEIDGPNIVQNGSNSFDIQEPRQKNMFQKANEEQQLLDHQDINIEVGDEARKFQNPNKSQFRGNKNGRGSNKSKISKQSSIYSGSSYRSTDTNAIQFKMEQPKFDDLNGNFEEYITFNKTKKDAIAEKTETESKISRIVHQIKALKKLTTSQKKGLHIDEIIKRFVKVAKQMESQIIDEKKFLDDDDGQQQEEGVDYGNRQIMHENFDEFYGKDLPYRKFPLFKFSQFKKFGFLRLKRMAILKAHLRVIEVTNAQLQQGSQMRSTISSLYSLKNQYRAQEGQDDIMSVISFETVYGSKIPKLKGHIGLVEYKSRLDLQDYPFNIFNPKHLQLFKEGFVLKCRVYINRCMNLSAQQSQISNKQFLGGNKAMCDASSYPRIQIGDGDQSRKEKIKYISYDKGKIEGTLSPCFYKMFELDANIPYDWKLIVKIMNSNSLTSDNEIGGFEIDLEDRLFMYQDLRQRIVLQMIEDDLSAQESILKYKYDEISKKEYQNVKTILSNLNQARESLNQDIKLPIEFKELKNPDKGTCQGTAEILIEPFTEEIAQLVPFSYFEAPKPLEFELRVVIWDTTDIPRINEQPNISIMVTAGLDKSATGTGEEIDKETDVHNGSEDGNGQFNWRMVFPFVIPAKFPRLRVQCYDFHVFEGADLIGETVINLNKTVNALRTEGTYELLPTEFEFFHPNFPGEVRGTVTISMQIISKQEANASEVGEGQNEPNQNPFLEKPTAGRGIGDFLKGGLSFNLYGVFLKQLLKYFLGVAISLITTMILFVNPGILVA